MYLLLLLLVVVDGVVDGVVEAAEKLGLLRDFGVFGIPQNLITNRLYLSCAV